MKEDTGGFLPLAAVALVLALCTTGELDGPADVTAEGTGRALFLGDRFLGDLFLGDFFLTGDFLAAGGFLVLFLF